MSVPLVSVIIPHFERADLVLETLHCVQAQTFTDWELIVVDDASAEDPTARVRTVVPHARVIVLERNGGASHARNTGVEAARGRFVAFLDSDDLWRPDKLEAQVAAAMARPDPDRVLAYTASEILGTRGVALTIIPPRGLRAGEDPGEYLFMNDGFVQTSSLFLARARAAEVRFAPELHMYEDFLIFLQLMARGADYVFVDRPLTGWRNDVRPNRLSTRSLNVVRNGEAFLRLAAPLMSRRAATAFIVKIMGLEYLKHRPTAMLAGMARGLAEGVVTPRYAIWMLLRRAVGPELYNRARGRKGQIMFGVEDRPD